MNNHEEVWVDIVDFPKYMVSNSGRIYSKYFNRIIGVGGITQGGYLQAHLRRNGIREIRYIHRLVADAFLEDDITGMEVDHLDDNNQNNWFWNLEVVTPKINSQRAYDRNRRIPPRMIPVRIVETGLVFRSVSECARYLDRSLSTTWAALNKGTTAAGYHIEREIA